MGCGSGSPSGPTTDATWHGALIEGTRRDEAVHVLNAAWPRVARRFPGRDLDGWRILWTETSINLSAHPTALLRHGAVRAGVRGGRTHTAPVPPDPASWAMAPSRLVSVAEWELCNALSDSGDRGCPARCGRSASDEGAGHGLARAGAVVEPTKPEPEAGACVREGDYTGE